MLDAVQIAVRGTDSAILTTHGGGIKQSSPAAVRHTELRPLRASAASPNQSESQGKAAGSGATTGPIAKALVRSG